ncbi:MAG: hypothetical protein HOA01_00535, partial [Flavobacteriales bacterium]|nr:hypothetical protein [Flavobacteriales bacterium]
MKNYSIVNTKYPIYILLFLFTFSSCITNRDLEYIRSSKEIKNAKANKQDYRLQMGDLISIQINTTTEQQHDFFNKENLANSQLM